MNIGIATAEVVETEQAVTPVEAWRMVNDLKISVEHLAKSDQWLATFRNDEEYIYLPVPGQTAFGAVQELLAQLGVEVAHG